MTRCQLRGEGCLRICVIQRRNTSENALTLLENAPNHSVRGMDGATIPRNKDTALTSTTWPTAVRRCWGCSSRGQRRAEQRWPGSWSGMQSWQLKPGQQEGGSSWRKRRCSERVGVPSLAGWRAAMTVVVGERQSAVQCSPVQSMLFTLHASELSSTQFNIRSQHSANLVPPCAHVQLYYFRVCDGSIRTPGVEWAISWLMHCTVVSCCGLLLASCSHAPLHAFMTARTLLSPLSPHHAYDQPMLRRINRQAGSGLSDEYFCTYWIAQHTTRTSSDVLPIHPPITPSPCTSTLSCFVFSPSALPCFLDSLPSFSTSSLSTLAISILTFFASSESPS